jgi:hypothetical protein
MDMCMQCQDQEKKTHRGTPHNCLVKIDDVRFFKGLGHRHYEEQDYQCQLCNTTFTWSSNRNDLAWTLWQG